MGQFDPDKKKTNLFSSSFQWKSHHQVGLAKYYIIDACLARLIAVNTL